MTTVLVVCRDATGAHWELGPASPDRPLTLLGWRTRPEPVDAGVPAPVAAILSRAMCATGWVAFPASPLIEFDEHEPRTDDATRVARVGVSRPGWRSVLGGARPIARQISTRRPEHARLLFEDSGHPWWLGAQVALISHPDHQPPTLDGATWRALLGVGWRGAADTLAPFHALGAIRAGVDGDVLGLSSATPAFADEFLRTVRDEAEAAGCTLREITETEFP